MRPLLAFALLLSALLAGCGEAPTEGASVEGAPDARPPVGTVPATPAAASGGTASGGTAPGGTAPTGSAPSPTPAPSSTPASSPTPAQRPASTSLSGTYRVAFDGWLQEATFRPDGTFTYVQSLDGEGATWEGTYDVAKGQSTMNGETAGFRIVHEDLVSLQEVLLRRVLPDGSVALPHASERLSGFFKSDANDRVDEFRFFTDGTWTMTGSLKTADSFGTWSGRGRYDVAQGALVWDAGLDAGKTERLLRWTEKVVVIGDRIHMQA